MASSPNCPMGDNVACSNLQPIFTSNWSIIFHKVGKETHDFGGERKRERAAYRPKDQILRGKIVMALCLGFCSVCFFLFSS